MSESKGDAGDGGFGVVVGEAFGVAGGEVSELFEFVEVAFDQVAVPLDIGVESWGRPLVESLGFRG